MSLLDTNQLLYPSIQSVNRDTGIFSLQGYRDIQSTGIQGYSVYRDIQSIDMKMQGNDFEEDVQYVPLNIVGQVATAE